MVKIASSILFLGTAGDSFVLGRNLRSSGGIILNIGDNQFHLDPGPNSLALARQCTVNLRANTAVLVSNSTLINSNDLNAVVDAMTYGGFDRKGVVISNKTIIKGDEGQEPVLKDFYKKCLERFIVLDPGKRVGVNEIEIQALKCRHSDPNAIGFKFFAPDFTLAYTSDTTYSRDLVEQYANSNILILNITAPSKSDAKHSIDVDDAVKIIKEVNPRLAILTHFGIKMLEGDPLYLVREIQKQTGVQTVAAKDGMAINPTSYAIDKGQRTLFAYPKKKEVEITEIESDQVPEPAEEPEQEPQPEPKQEEKKEEPKQEPQPEPKKEPEEKQEPKIEPKPELKKEDLDSEKTLKDIFLEEESKEKPEE